MSREVMQQALESLRDCWGELYSTSPMHILDAIAGLEAELAKPEPKPDGYHYAYPSYRNDGEVIVKSSQGGLWNGAEPTRAIPYWYAPPADVVRDAYEKGWRTAANWMDRDDLIADIGSPAFEADYDVAMRGEVSS